MLDRCGRVRRLRHARRRRTDMRRDDVARRLAGAQLHVAGKRRRHEGERRAVRVPAGEREDLRLAPIAQPGVIEPQPALRGVL